MHERKDLTTNEQKKPPKKQKQKNIHKIYRSNTDSKSHTKQRSRRSPIHPPKTIKDRLKNLFFKDPEPINQKAKSTY